MGCVAGHMGKTYVNVISKNAGSQSSLTHQMTCLIISNLTGTLSSTQLSQTK